MINSQSTNSTLRVCNLKYLIDTMGEKKHLIKEIMDVFLLQVPEELLSINKAIADENYPIIKNFSHTMKSTVSIMGISVLAPILQEMEELSAIQSGLEKLKWLNQELNSICQLAISEIKIEITKYN